MKEELHVFMASFTEQVKILYGEDIEIKVCNVSVREDLLANLPPQLKGKIKNKKAFRKAMKAGLITCHNGQWVSHFASVRMLAYFLGRCCCSDSVTGRCIHKGKGHFPARGMEHLFGVNGLCNARKKVLKNKIPEDYQLFDFLFDMRP